VKGFRWMALSVLALVSVVHVQGQKFPLRPGEWEAVNQGQDPTPILYCLNDEMWQKGLTQNPSCTIKQLNITSGGASYSIDCPFKSFQMKGDVTLTFDGMEHMTSKGNFVATVNGQSTTHAAAVDYRWKNPQCSPNDMNMRSHDKP
jgi:hypothetical protein